MTKRFVTCIIALIALVGGVVACGETQVETPSPEPKSIWERAPEEVGEQFTNDASDVLPALARISIMVDDEAEPDEFPYQREWMHASIKVFTDNDSIYEGRAGIHVRGNTSRDFDKKSYALETWDANDEDLDVGLLGLPAEEDWVLQGPFSDKSLIRNHLIYTLSRDIGRYAARTRFVELEINSEYRGVYVLMEKIKRDDTRMALPSGAVLLKRDWVEGGNRFIQTTSCKDDLKVEWPDVVDDIVARLDAVEAELLGGSFGSIDLNSFVDHMLIVELGRNVDGYVLSTWITLSEDNILGMGPVWDYNGALGNASYFEAWIPEGWHYENPEFPGDNPRGFCWYEALLGNEPFLELRRERWQMHRAGAWSDVAIEARIDEAVAILEPAIDKNFERWPILGTVVWPNDLDAQSRTTFIEEVTYLKSWVRERTAWMDLALRN